MVATTVSVTIGADNVSGDVLEINIQRHAKFLATACRIAVDNSGNKYGGHFLAGEAVTIEINSVELFVGEVEVANMEVDQTLYDRTWFAVDCRGADHELVDLFMTRAYPYTSLQTAKADDVIEDAIDFAGSGYTYTSPSTAPEVEIEFRKTYLGAGFRKICERINYDGYIDDSDTLHFFPEGDAGAHTSVDLIAKDKDLTTNLLDFVEGEEDATTVKNYVEISAGEAKDHYTEDADDWTPGTGCSVANEYTIKLSRGKRSIKLSKGAGGEMSMYLGLPFGGYTYWNLTKPGQASFWVFHDLIAGTVWCRPRLRDSYGNEIEYATDKVVDEEQGTTEDILPRAWHQVDFPYGAENKIILADLAIGRWYYLTRATRYDAGTDFTEANIDTDYGGQGFTRITLTGGAGIFSNFNEDDLIQLTNCEDGANNGEYQIQNIVSDYIIELYDELDVQNVQDTAIQIRQLFDWLRVDRLTIAAEPVVQWCNLYVDFLEIPTIEVIDIIESAASQALYNKRMHWEPHYEATSQTELEEINTELLEKRKWPLKTAKAWAVGQTGSRYAALSLDVDAPVYGVTPATKYRILSLRHIVKTHGVEGFEAENFVTIYDLISDELSPDSQEVQTHRFMYSKDPSFAALEYLRERMEDSDKLDIPVDVFKYSRIPGDDELAGLVTFDTEANILAMTPENDGAMAFATDTRIWYGWNIVDSDDDWDELTRAEVMTRLAELLEKDHDSIDNVGNDDHHNRDHQSRHETGSADELDTQGNGAHTHSIAAASGYSNAEDEITAYLAASIDPLYDDYGYIVELVQDLYANDASDGSGNWVAFKAIQLSGGLSTYRRWAYKTSSATHYIIETFNLESDVQLRNHTHGISGTALLSGNHTHNVTTSPTEHVEDVETNAMLEILADRIEDGQRVVNALFPEFDLEYCVRYPIDKNTDSIIKDLKMRYHHLKIISNMPTSEVKDALTGRKLRWDAKDEELYIKAKREATFAEVDSVRANKEAERGMRGLFGDED